MAETADQRIVTADVLSGAVVDMVTHRLARKKHFRLKAAHRALTGVLDTA